jgi:allantoinase
MTIPMRPDQRLAYMASIDRPKLALPDGKAVAVWPVVNVEHWLIDNPTPRQVLVAPTGVQLAPDIPNWAWHEYGMRVGFWRFLEAFERRGIKPTLSVPPIRASQPLPTRLAGSSWDMASCRCQRIELKTSAP